MSDDLTNPAHYTRFSIEPIDAIESWGLNFRLANVVKYVARADHKGQRERDLRKAIWYLERELSRPVTREEVDDLIKHGCTGMPICGCRACIGKRGGRYAS